MLDVQDRQCATCIYRVDSHFDVPALLAQIADPRMVGFFSGYRICHHSTTAVCRGFWDRHRDNFTVGQLAQRLNVVRFVHHDVERT